MLHLCRWGLIVHTPVIRYVYDMGTVSVKHCLIRFLLHKVPWMLGLTEFSSCQTYLLLFLPVVYLVNIIFRSSPFVLPGQTNPVPHQGAWGHWKTQWGDCVTFYTLRESCRRLHQPQMQISWQEIHCPKWFLYVWSVGEHLVVWSPFLVFPGNDYGCDLAKVGWNPTLRMDVQMSSFLFLLLFIKRSTCYIKKSSCPCVYLTIWHTFLRS